MTPFSKHSLTIDAAAETERLVHALRDTVVRVLKRRGAVVGISGGIDSSVVLALSVRAFGPDRVAALILPERDSSPDSARLARDLAKSVGVTPVMEELTAALEGFGCYRRRDEAIRRVFPEYDAAAGYKAKIVLPQNLLERGSLNVYSVTIVTPEGRELTKPLPPRDFLQIVAASNFKQRSRTAMLYYHAEIHNFAVMGTANKNEHDQGFFVKYGDSGVDVKVIGHLYKTQVYQLARHLNIPKEIQERPPTTDTYSAPCTQEEFFFRLPFETMDYLWFGMEHEVPAQEMARVMGLSESQVQRVLQDLRGKYRATEYLRLPPVEVGPPTPAPEESPETAPIA